MATDARAIKRTSASVLMEIAGYGFAKVVV